MPEPNEANPDGQENEIDAFGEPTNPSDPPKEPENKDDDKGKDKGGEKKFETIPDDHPTIVALKGEIENVKKEYGGNLSGQREVIDRLEKEIETLKKGGEKEEGEVLFKEVKTSKDLTDEQKEEMTETEIKQMDEIAELKNALNKLYGEGKKKETEGAESQEANVNQVVQDTAKELAKASAGKEDTELANQIIQSFKDMKFNLEGLKEEEIKSRVATAAKEISTYKPPKEQTGKRGKSIKGKTDGEVDPFGKNDEIVEQVGKGNDGSYNL